MRFTKFTGKNNRRLKESFLLYSALKIHMKPTHCYVFRAQIPAFSCLPQSKGIKFLNRRGFNLSFSTFCLSPTPEIFLQSFFFLSLLPSKMAFDLPPPNCSHLLWKRWCPLGMIRGDYGLPKWQIVS